MNDTATMVAMMQEKNKPMKIAIVSIVGLVVITLAYLIWIRPYIKRKREEKKKFENNQITTSDGTVSPKTEAVNLRNAIKGPGTRENIVWSFAHKCGQKKLKYEDVAAAYQELFDRDLILDIQEDLRSSWEMEVFNNLLDPQNATFVTTKRNYKAYKQFNMFQD